MLFKVNNGSLVNIATPAGSYYIGGGVLDSLQEHREADLIIVDIRPLMPGIELFQACICRPQGKERSYFARKLQKTQRKDLAQ